ncbi:MAG: hypothetical protein CVV11_16870 [Gammaproteobacteria bacterium HGW-Gammaproteobacteria-15]|nr:MAG: hypothetical protein CVV11_16870 [Gammaproteobacteria bacterium HGW-Gammaproteobacteria-15]
MSSIETIYENIKRIQVSSQQMHDYINGLSESDYALLASAFILGRSGWERSYEDSNDFHRFIEEKASEGINVDQKMLDDKFLSMADKNKQFSITHEYEKSDISKANGIYRHNWLSSKTNLITEVEKGIKMLREIQ